MRLSIITVNRNNSKGLAETINSVVNQSVSDFEYIIIDGASTDASVDIIKNNSERLTFWVSEPDSGIYNAMNKGIRNSHGEYLLFLNSGDCLADKNVVEDFLSNIFSEDIVSGHVKLMYELAPEIRYAPEEDQVNYGLLFGGGGRIVHQSTFIRRDLFEKYGFYNENNKIVSDWEFFLLVLVFNNASYICFNRLISFYDMNGISAQTDFDHIHYNELVNVHLDNYPRVYVSYKKLYEEVIELRKIRQEYYPLKNGMFKYIISLILKLKNLKKSND